MKRFLFFTVFCTLCLLFVFQFKINAEEKNVNSEENKENAEEKKVNSNENKVNAEEKKVNSNENKVNVEEKKINSDEKIIIREAAVAGRFYDNDPKILCDRINNLLKIDSKVVINDKPIALISPHAGYMYSGLIAAHGYSVVKQHDYDRVIILAPSHNKRFRGGSIGAFTHYKTPLGLVEIDRQICDKLLRKPKSYDKRQFWPFGTMDSAHVSEHSLETQLPFLQVVLKKNFKIIPILLGYLKIEDYAEIAKQLKLLLTEKTLIVASSDFMHYGAGYGYVPFKNDIEKNIRKYDFKAFEGLIDVDFNYFRAYKMQTESTICGANPIAVLLKTLPHNTKGQLIAYDTSGSQTGNFTNSVSYASLAFTFLKDKTEE